MSYEQWIELAIANEENRRDLEFPELWDEPVYIPGVSDE
jgi:hypothetical protein